MDIQNQVLRCRGPNFFSCAGEAIVMFIWLVGYLSSMALFFQYALWITILFILLLLTISYLFSRPVMSNHFEFDQKTRTVKVRRPFGLRDRTFPFSDIQSVSASLGSEGATFVYMQLKEGGGWTIMDNKNFKEAQREARGITEFLAGAG